MYTVNIYIHSKIICIVCEFSIVHSSTRSKGMPTSYIFYLTMIEKIFTYSFSVLYFILTFIRSFFIFFISYKILHKTRISTNINKIHI